MKFVVDAKSQLRERGASLVSSPRKIIGFYQFYPAQLSNASPSCGGRGEPARLPKTGVKRSYLTRGNPYLDGEALEISRLGLLDRIGDLEIRSLEIKMHPLSNPKIAVGMMAPRLHVHVLQQLHVQDVNCFRSYC